MKPVILLVDDEEHVLNALRRLLRTEKYQILTASSGDQALEIMQGVTPNVVVSDQKMPGMQGTEFLKVVKEKYPGTVRIMLTGHADLETAVSAINEGAIYRFFTKPCNEIDLALTIREAIQQRNLIDHSYRLIEILKMQSTYIEQLEKEAPGISTVERDARGAILIKDETYNLEKVCQEALQELEAADQRLGRTPEKK